MDCRTIPWTFVLDEPLRILVVDDDAILCEFADVYLSTPTVKIDTVHDGLQARARLQEQHYDLLLLDIEMPRLDGFSLLSEIRSSEALKSLPVIMLTGHDDIASIDRAYQLGANSFATKPVNWRQLSYHIRYVIRMGRIDQQPAEPRPPRTEPVPQSRSAPIESAMLGFLHSVIAGADAVAEQLTAQDQARYSASLQSLRAAAAQAINEASRHASTDAVSGRAVNARR